MAGVDSDLLLVIGMIVGGFAIPAVLSAMSDSRPPRAAAVAFVIGGGLILAAFMTRPGGYSSGQIPEAFIRVIARFLN